MAPLVIIFVIQVTNIHLPFKIFLMKKSACRNPEVSTHSFSSYHEVPRKRSYFYSINSPSLNSLRTLSLTSLHKVKSKQRHRRKKREAHRWNLKGQMPLTNGMNFKQVVALPSTKCLSKSHFFTCRIRSVDCNEVACFRRIILNHRPKTMILLWLRHHQHKALSQWWIGRSCPWSYHPRSLPMRRLLGLPVHNTKSPSRSCTSHRLPESSYSNSSSLWSCHPLLSKLQKWNNTTKII